MAADTFALDLKRFAEKAGDNARQVVRKVSMDLLTNVVLRTPVGNPSLWKGKAPAGYVGGRLRNNWNVSLGSADYSTGNAPDKSGRGALGQGANVIANADGSLDLFIVNALPYVREIEYQGHSKQAPAGMVRITVTQWRDFIAQAVRELPK